MMHPRSFLQRKRGTACLLPQLFRNLTGRRFAITWCDNWLELPGTGSRLRLSRQRLLSQVVLTQYAWVLKVRPYGWATMSRTAPIRVAC